MPSSRSSFLVLTFNLCLALLVFTLPTHFFVKWGVSQAYVRGLLIDYLLPKLYLSDIVATVLLLLGLWQLKPSLSSFTKPRYLILGLLTMLLVLVQLTRSYALPATIMGFRLTLLLVLGWVVWHSRTFIKRDWIVNAVVVTVMFQSTLGLFQFLTQHSFIGYSLLGEPTLSAVSGLATANIDGAELILPYGTTAHPNVLAGVLAIYLIVIMSHLVNHWHRSQTFFLVTALILGSLTLYFTHSLSGYCAFLIGLFLIFGHQKYAQFSKYFGAITILALLLIPFTIHVAAQKLPNNPSVTRRDLLNQNALTLWRQQPLLGLGLSSNAAVGESVSAVQETVRFAQPTHDIPLLWLSETGILGILWLGCLLYVLQNYFRQRVTLSAWWLVVIPIVGLDHYLLTTEAGVLLILFIVSGILNFDLPKVAVVEKPRD